MATPQYFTGLVGANDNDVLKEVTNADFCDTWILGSTAGAFDVFVSGDGTNYLASALALIDLHSTAPSTAVVVTTAGKSYGIKGRWKKIKLLQNGATAVENGFLIGYLADR